MRKLILAAAAAAILPAIFLAPAAALAQLEGLEAHARAADLRRDPPLPFSGRDGGAGQVRTASSGLDGPTAGPAPTPPLKGRGS